MVRWCDGARGRRCEGATVRGCEGAVTRCEGVGARVRQCEGAGATACVRFHPARVSRRWNVAPPHAPSRCAAMMASPRALTFPAVPLWWASPRTPGTLAPSHPRTFAPSHLRTLRTFAPSHLRTLAPSHPRTLVLVSQCGFLRFASSVCLCAPWRLCPRAGKHARGLRPWHGRRGGRPGARRSSVGRWRCRRSPRRERSIERPATSGPVASRTAAELAQVDAGCRFVSAWLVAAGSAAGDALGRDRHAHPDFARRAATLCATSGSSWR